MSESITIHQIFISSGHDFKGRYNKGRLNHGVQEVESVECVEGRGLVGDRYFDFKEDFKGQLSFISVEAIEALEKDLEIEQLDRSAFRRNAVVSGVDLNSLVGREFRIGELELRGTEQCEPCFWMDEAIGQGVHAALEERGGLRCRVLKTGKLEKGEAVLETLN